MDEEVFETPDFADETSLLSVPEEAGLQTLRSSDIETAAVQPEHAFEVFCGKRFVGSDLSDAVGRSDAPERLLAHTHLESPHERFNRLRSEVNQLAEDLGDGSEGSSHYEGLVRGVSELQGQLDGLDSSTAVPLVHSGVSEQLRKLQQPVSTAAAPSASEGAVSKPTGGVTYQLYYAPDQRSQSAQARLAAMDSRVAALERGLGQEGDKSAEAGVSLSEKLSRLEGRIALLDEDTLLRATRQVKVLGAELAALKQERSREQSGADSGDGSSPEEVRRLDKMFDRLERWDEVATSLPALVERLHALRAVHEQSASFESRLREVESAQVVIKDLAAKDAELLENVRHSVAENAKILEKNVAAIVERLARLQGAA